MIGISQDQQGSDDKYETDSIELYFANAETTVDSARNTYNVRSSFKEPNDKRAFTGSRI